MTAIYTKVNSRLSLVTLTQVSMGINVVTLIVLLPATIVLYWQLEIHSSLQSQHPFLAGCDVTESSDVMESQKEGREASEGNRYCYKEDPVACAEKGMHVKLGKDGHSLCCGHLGKHLFEVMSEAVARRLLGDRSRAYQLQRVKRCIEQLHQDSHSATLRPAAHVGISSNWNLTLPDNPVPRIQWDDSAEGSFLTGGVIHRADRLMVKQPGYYYVYSGLQFDVDPAKDQHGTVVAYLFRTFNGTEESRRKLMTSRESSCRQTRGDDHEGGSVSLHMAGIFLLRRGDEISVRATSPALLNKSPAATYLGMHMV